MSASVACISGELTVMWDIPVPAENYTTIISRGMGQRLNCNSTGTQCTTEGLVCGSSYTVIVFSVTGTCLSLPSDEVTVQSCKILKIKCGRAQGFSWKFCPTSVILPLL